MKVYSTLRADQIDITRSASEGVAGVKAFLDYAEKGRSTLGIKKTGVEINESGFEKLVANEIRKNDYEVHTNIGCSGYRIDIAIVNKQRPSEYIMGILCDGHNYYAAKTAKDREIIQQEVLKLLGWKLHKIWSTDWWENGERVLNETLAAIKNAEINKEVVIDELSLKSAAVEVEKKEPGVLNNGYPATEIISSINSLPNKEYKICTLDMVLSTSSDDFLQFRNFQKIKQQIQAVIEIEAPITRNLLAKRVLTAWGISKLGVRINAQFEQLLNESNLRKTGLDENIVFWSNDFTPADYTGYRVLTASGQKRDAEDIPSEEIANAIKDILSHQISLPNEELIREASRIFGFARSGANVESAMRKGINKAILNGYVFEKDGRVIFKEIHEN